MGPHWPEPIAEAGVDWIDGNISVKHMWRFWLSTKEPLPGGRGSVCPRALPSRDRQGAVGFLVALLMVLPAPAQEVTAPQRVGVGITQRKLTLREAVELALKANLDIEIERTVTATAREQERAAKGFLDPVFRWQPLLESRNTPTSSILLGANGKERAQKQRRSRRTK